MPTLHRPSQLTIPHAPNLPTEQVQQLVAQWRDELRTQSLDAARDVFPRVQDILSANNRTASFPLEFASGLQEHPSAGTELHGNQPPGTILTWATRISCPMGGTVERERPLGFDPSEDLTGYNNMIIHTQRGPGHFYSFNDRTSERGIDCIGAGTDRTPPTIRTASEHWDHLVEQLVGRVIAVTNKQHHPTELLALNLHDLISGTMGRFERDSVVRLQLFCIGLAEIAQQEGIATPVVAFRSCYRWQRYGYSQTVVLAYDGIDASVFIPFENG